MGQKDEKKTKVNKTPAMVNMVRHIARHQAPSPTPEHTYRDSHRYVHVVHTRSRILFLIFYAGHWHTQAYLNSHPPTHTHTHQYV